MGKREEWADNKASPLWRQVYAPRLLKRKREIGRSLPEQEIAAAVETATGRDSSRQLVSLWLHGKREPFITQFFALCSKLEVDPAEILEPVDKRNERVVSGLKSRSNSQKIKTSR